MKGLIEYIEEASNEFISHIRNLKLSSVRFDVAPMNIASLFNASFIYLTSDFIFYSLVNFSSP